MVCPYCHENTQVTNSRVRAKGAQVWRRRSCRSCRAVWSTREEIDLTTSHLIQSESDLEPFSRDILFVSIKDSLQHKKTALSDATALTDTIIAQVLAQKSAHIPKHLLTETTYTVLRNFDPTAAAVYKATHGL